MSSAPPPHNLKYVVASILDAREDVIVHQGNCISTFGRGLAASIADVYPHADVYASRTPSSTRSSIADEASRGILGSIALRGKVGPPLCTEPRAVCMLFSQYAPGVAGTRYRDDTAASRLHYFRQALETLTTTVSLRSIAVPYKIGCGLAGGNWRSYKEALDDFARAHHNIRVVIYSVEEIVADE